MKPSELSHRNYRSHKASNYHSHCEWSLSLLHSPDLQTPRSFSDRVLKGKSQHILPLFSKLCSGLSYYNFLMNSQTVRSYKRDVLHHDFPYILRDMDWSNPLQYAVRLQNSRYC